MKANIQDNNGISERTSTNIYLAACQKLLGEIASVKNKILAEFRDAFTVPAHLLELALNEAEALAVETGIPHLVFPTLATEKVQSAVAWYRKQQSLRSNHIPSVKGAKQPMPRKGSNPLPARNAALMRQRPRAFTQGILRTTDRLRSLLD